MINYSEAYINKIIVHKIGNKSHGEGIVVSDELVFPNEALREVLMDYFLKPFTKVTETYQFVHNVDIGYNVVNDLAKFIFKDQNDFKYKSVDILRHLYDQSNHPHIKSGDLFVVLFGDVLLNDELVDAIGIFKSEDRIPFLDVIKEEDNLEIVKQLGISIRKLDKGCLIFNTDLDNGARVLSVDTNSYDTEYWLSYFLNVDYIRDSNFETRTYLEMCRSFSDEVIKEKESKKEQIDFLNQSIAYFEENDMLLQHDFRQTVFEDEVLKEEFANFKTEYENDHGVVLSETFDISPVVLKKQQKREIKNFIKLDTNIQIKLDFRNPDSSRKFMEKGYDEEKEMYYYKVYFNEEVD
ncbi:MAG: nucleoid-associated protein [Bacteroidota bacterium]